MDTPQPAPDGTLDACGRQRQLVARTRERFTAVQELRAQGLSFGAIRRQLNLDHGTVRRYARASSADELLVKAINRTSKLDTFKPYLGQRWNEGCHDAALLHAELQALEHKSSMRYLDVAANSHGAEKALLPHRALERAACAQPRAAEVGPGGAAVSISRRSSPPGCWTA